MKIGVLRSDPQPLTSAPIPCDYCERPSTRIRLFALRRERRFTCENKRHRGLAADLAEPLPCRSRFLELHTDELQARWKEANERVERAG